MSLGNKINIPKFIPCSSIDLSGFRIINHKARDRVNINKGILFTNHNAPEMDTTPLPVSISTKLKLNSSDGSNSSSSDNSSSIKYSVIIADNHDNLYGTSTVVHSPLSSSEHCMRGPLERFLKLENRGPDYTTHETCENGDGQRLVMVLQGHAKWCP